MSLLWWDESSPLLHSKRTTIISIRFHLFNFWHCIRERFQLTSRNFSFLNSVDNHGHHRITYEVWTIHVIEVTIVFIIDKMIWQALKDFIKKIECLLIITAIHEWLYVLLIRTQHSCNLVTIVINITFDEDSFDFFFQRSEFYVCSRYKLIVFQSTMYVF